MIIEKIVSFLSPIIVGFIAAYFGSIFALSKFKRQKSWEERRSAYKEVIESFEELIHWSEQIRATHCCEPIIGGEAKFDESLRKIAKFSATGDLMFSNEFQEALKKANTLISRARFQIDEESKPDLYTEVGRAEWFYILANEIRTIVEKYLPKLINIAKREVP